VKILFQITRELIEALPEKDYEVIEMAQDGEVKLYKLRPLLARFVVDDAGAKMPHAAAMRLLGEIPITQWGDVVNQFANALKTGTVPKANGTPLNSPSDPVSEISASPDGSV
jgi:hypothetical protein